MTSDERVDGRDPSGSGAETGTPAAGEFTGVYGRIPATLGRYRVLHLIGEGGMGTVYKVEQDRPHRIVALKVIRPGLQSEELLRRFERESEVLARLHHPGVAQIFEVGTADAGSGPQPYFAMEFIKGAPLHEYARTHGLNTRQRLELVAKVCDAVEHAHQRGIIHRDLKPGNVLVDESGQPKVLDFGVARATDSDARATRQTDVGQLIGTLAYMSPEQVLGDPLELDTRSDVYALGVILFELLADRLPYELGANLLDSVRAIREEDPARLSSISRSYRGDVETIVAKALEKDRTRRYSSASALAADIRRYLSDEPITARPASTTYQLQKFARRHRALVTAAAVIVVVLTGGIVVSASAAVKARRAEQASEAVNDFLQNDLLAQASAATQSGPNAKPDPDLKVRTALDRAAAKIGGKFGQQPEIEASIRYTIGRTYLDLGLYPEARAQFDRALDLNRRVLGTDNAATLRTLSRVGRTALLQDRYPDAETALSQALTIQRRVLGVEHADSLYSANNLAEVYFATGKYTQAETLDTETLAIQQRVLGPDNVGTLATMNSLGNVYADQGKTDQAVKLHEQAVEGQRRVLGAEHPDTLVTMNNLGSDYAQQNDSVRAAAIYARALEIQRRVLGTDHPDTPMTMTNLGRMYGFQGKYEQAEPLFREALEIQRRVLGPEHTYTLVSMENLATTYEVLGRHAEADELFGKTLEISRRALGPEHPITLAVLADLGSIYERRGEYAQAQTYTEQALEGRRHALGADHLATMSSIADLALVYMLQGKFAESEPLARQAFDFTTKNLPDGWERYGEESLLGAILAGQKKFSEAEPLLLDGYRGMDARKAAMGVPNLYYLDRVRGWIADLYQSWGKSDKAAEWRTPRT
jgi:tetratricopeptide (TPR) repeat protein/tRNA A-37 threonylcarbamoyl transferase component Bud32